MPESERRLLVEGLRGLLGRRVAEVTIADAARARAVGAEIGASLREARRHDWGCVRRAWPAGDPAPVSDTLHLLSRNLGPRDVWLAGMLTVGWFAAALRSDDVLDNPLGFAALDLGRRPGGARMLVLFDAQVPAGLWLTGGDRAWELEVWGEPWLSATTRALRGVG